MSLKSSNATADALANVMLRQATGSNKGELSLNAQRGAQSALLNLLGFIVKFSLKHIFALFRVVRLCGLFVNNVCIT
jgi:uncharacterized UBP type Zn finger protein